MTDGLIWLLAGFGGLIAEMLLPGVFLLWLGVAAILVGMTVEVSAPPFLWQVVEFAVLAPVAVLAGLRLRPSRRRMAVNSQGSGLIGRSAVVLSCAGRELRVRVGDSDWAARLAGAGEAPQAGARALVTGIDGTCLLIEIIGTAA